MLLILLACRSAEVPDSGVESRRESIADSPVESKGDSEEPLPAGLVVLDHLHLIDHRGSVPDQALLLSGEQIYAVRPAGGPWPEDAVVHDFTGSYALPGLVDPHVHLALSGALVPTGGPPLEAALRANLYAGVTTVVDLGGPTSIFELRDQVAAGEVLGPNILATGPMFTATGSHPCESFPDPDACTFVTAENAQDLAEARRAEGADLLKLAYANAAFTDWPTPRLEAAAMAEIVAAGLPVAAHIDTEEDALDALDAGVGILAHPPFDDALSASGRLLVQADAIHSTLGAFTGIGRILDGDLLPDGLILADGVAQDWLYWKSNPDHLQPGWAEATADWAIYAAVNLDLLRAQGATILPASDAGYYFVPPGAGLILELKALEELGFSPEDLLRASTWDSRQLLGLSGGELSAGQPAELLVLARSPLERVSNLDTLSHVVIHGTMYQREEFKSISITEANVEPCLSDDTCPEGKACNPLTHRCAELCSPAYAASGACDDQSWCMPTQTGSVCHPEDSCDLYLQDCPYPYYQQSCIPMDIDSNRCGPSGEGRVGDACNYLLAEDACAPGLFCSTVDNRCYELCDPQNDHCPGLQSCVAVEEAGQVWFGLCL